MAPPNVTNAQIVEALRLIGYPEQLFQGLSISGAQNTTFADRLQRAGIGGAAFEQAKAVARFRVDYKPGEWGERQSIETINLLQTLGATPEQIQQVKDRAADLVRGGTITAAGAPGFGYVSQGQRLTIPLTAFARAAADVLGPVLGNAVTTVTGITPPPPSALPAPGQAPPGPPTVGPRGAPGKAKGLPGAPTPAVGVPTPTAEPTVAQQVQAGITAGLAGLPKPKEATPQEIRALVNSTYGWAAGLADIPEIATILDQAASGQISVPEVGNRFKSTHYYKTTTEAARNWKVLSTTSPGDAADARQKRHGEIVALVKGIGIEMDPARLEAMVDSSLRYGWNDAQVKSFLANEVHYDPTRAKTGMLASMKEAQRQYLVPLSDQAMSAWASAVVAGTKTPEDFDAYLRDSASSLFPALGEALKDPNMTTRKYLDPYGQVIAKTLGTNAEDIDWLDPKYQRFLTQVDDKGQRKVMPLSDVQRTLMNDPTYKWDETTAGQQAKASLSTGLMKSFGFA